MFSAVEINAQLGNDYDDLLFYDTGAVSKQLAWFVYNYI